MMLKPQPSLVPLLSVLDSRGELYCCEHRAGSDFPFDIKRMLCIKKVPFFITRGGHAHFCCHQLIMAVSGKIMVRTDNGTEKDDFLLTRPSHGLYIPPMVWAEQTYSEDAVSIVMASDIYDEADYIRTYDRFLEELNRFKEVS